MVQFDSSRRNGLTYEAWVAQQELPAGFAQWTQSYAHWDQGNNLGWAIHCYRKSKQWRKLQWHMAKKARNASSKEQSAR